MSYVAAPLSVSPAGAAVPCASWLIVFALSSRCFSGRPGHEKAPRREGRPRDVEVSAAVEEAGCSVAAACAHRNRNVLVAARRLALGFRTVADLSRYEDWMGWLRRRADADADVRGGFIGGSAVTGGYDDHSDLDVEVLASPGEAVAAYHRLLQEALSEFEVHQVWELPESTWPDGRQA